ncbi:hypothetical protein ACLB2K_045292 [Fragaria x ananassa]
MGKWIVDVSSSKKEKRLLSPLWPSTDGAGGFVGSWVVKLLLSKNCIVHGTIREPTDAKYSHLKKLDKASENLKLFKADLLNYDSLRTAIEGCDGVFHVASPVPSGSVPNPEASVSNYSLILVLAVANMLVEIIEPAVKGTLNVLKASLEAKVKRVVFVSSVAAVSVNPAWAEGQVLDETCWSDKEYCRNTENWYCLSKTEAEYEALQFANTTGIDLVTVCPTLIFGPILQSTVNASTLILIKLLKEGKESLENRPRKIVDVRDLAEALLMAYEKPKAEGRYICMSHSVKNRDLVEKLRRLYPNYNYPKNFVEVGEEKQVSSEKLQRLGVMFCLAASFESITKRGNVWHGLLQCQLDLVKPEPKSDRKYEHLNKLEKASENLKLFKADLLDYDSLCSAISGCSGVFHVASPVPTTEVKDPEAEVLEPAVRGTLNVLKACLEAKVKRVVLVSSTAAVVMNPNWPKDQVKDESCWSDTEYIKTTSMKTSKKWYYVSKTQAEREALEFGRTTGLEVVTVCSSAILGPVLQSTLISSSWLVPMGLKGGFGSLGYNYWTVVDVRDLAEALLLAYKKADAGERYICTSHAMGVEEVVEKYIKISYPTYNYSDKLSHTEEEEEKVSSEKLQKLGWSYRPFEETIADAIENCRKIGVLD